MFSTLDHFCTWLQGTWLSQAISSTAWIIPALQTLHILAVSLVFSSALFVYLRAARILRGETTTAAVARRFLPFVWWPLPVLLITGALLITAEPARSLENPSFALKITLLVAALVVTVSYQSGLHVNADFWQGALRRRVTGRLLAIASLLLWPGVILAGRWIAYTQP
jgi:hypothetical protein